MGSTSLGTLGGATASGFITYFVQKYSLDRKRRWEKEDALNERQRVLTVDRVVPIEAYIQYMMQYIDLPSNTQEQELEQLEELVEDTYKTAWLSVKILDSDELWSAIEAIYNVYRDKADKEVVEPREKREANQALVKATKILDEFRIK